MPNYYNPYVYNTNPGSAVSPYYYGQQNSGISYGIGMPANNYWISVDGEMAARAWQMPSNLPPNTIIPLWDLDGQHVYFKSTDAYGRINPIRKGRVVFDEEVSNITAESESASNAPVEQSAIDPSKYVTKEDFDGLKREIQEMLKNHAFASNEVVATNQNGNGLFDQSKGYSKNRR